MGNKISFRADPSLIPKLRSIPERERSTVIRQALRRYFQEQDLKGVIIDDEQNPERTQTKHQGVSDKMREATNDGR